MHRMKNTKTIAVILVILLSCYYWYHQFSDYQRRERKPDNRYDVLAREYEISREKNKELTKRICNLERQSDSLSEIATNENKIIHKLIKHRHENLKAIDHFNDVELAGFFARLKADSSDYKH